MVSKVGPQQQKETNFCERDTESVLILIVKFFQKCHAVDVVVARAI
jgi:hypothetical protein